MPNKGRSYREPAKLSRVASSAEETNDDRSMLAKQGQADPFDEVWVVFDTDWLTPRRPQSEAVALCTSEPALSAFPDDRFCSGGTASASDRS